MKFDLIRPCVHCPFRSDRKPFLRQERAREIADALLHDQTFACHKTVDYSDESDGECTSDSQHCVGATIILERLKRPNQMMRWMHRLGGYDHTKLDMAAPVYPDFDAWIEVQS